MYQTEVKPIAIMDEDFEGKLKGTLDRVKNLDPDNKIHPALSLWVTGSNPPPTPTPPTK
jgi:hypothetical protein